MAPDNDSEPRSPVRPMGSLLVSMSPGQNFTFGRMPASEEFDRVAQLLYLRTELSPDPSPTPNLPRELVVSRELSIGETRPPIPKQDGQLLG